MILPSCKTVVLMGKHKPKQNCAHNVHGRYRTRSFVLSGDWLIRQNTAVGIVRQFNSQNGHSMPLGRWVRHKTQAHLDMFQLVYIQATDQISHLFPSSRGSSRCPRYTVVTRIWSSGQTHRLMVNMLWRNWVFWMAQAVQGRATRSARWPKKWEAKNAMNGYKWEHSTNLGASDQRLCVRLIAGEGYGNLLRGKDLDSGLTSGFPTISMSLRMMR
jgi:hypothetical protein